MKTISIQLMILLLGFLIPFACSRGDQVDPEVARLYHTNEPIKPLPEYTRENPREWWDVADEHIPQVLRSRRRGQDAIVITVPLKKPTYEHYIQRIGIIDDTGREIVSRSIERLPNPKTHVFFLLKDLPLDTSKLKVFGKCNIHHRWTIPYKEALK